MLFVLKIYYIDIIAYHIATNYFRFVNEKLCFFLLSIRGQSMEVRCPVRVLLIKCKRQWLSEQISLEIVKIYIFVCLKLVESICTFGHFHCDYLSLFNV